MKTALISIVALLFVSLLFGQQSGSMTYAVHFKDKGVNLKASINPALYLSEKSIERRLKQQISFDESDIPVNSEYMMDVSQTGARIISRSRWLNTVVIEGSPEIVSSVSKLPCVTSIQQLTSGKITSSANSKFLVETKNINPWTERISKKATLDLYDYGAAYNQINQLHGQYLHNNGFSGQGMTIAVIDAGFNSADIMPCFDSLRANNQIKGTRDFAQPGNNVYGTNMSAHGSEVLSCMGAYVSGQMIGTAPKADYWLLRSEVAATEYIIEEYYWVSAAEFADSIGADLINSSLGYTVFEDSLISHTNHTYADMDGNTTVVTIGADKAAEKGILVVNSAGNEGSGPWRYIGAPADGDSVFTIGAVDFNGNRAFFSSVGPTSDGRIKPTVAAQGQSAAIYYPGGFGLYGDGTSFSSPICCGITACLWQANPNRNNMQIIEAIKATASQANQPDAFLGWGIPNYESASSTLSVNIETAGKVLFSYPNPVMDRLTLAFPDAIMGKYNLEIVDIHGKVAYSAQGNENSLRSLQINNIGTLSAGIYMVRVSNGRANYSGKIIKM